MRKAGQETGGGTGSCSQAEEGWSAQQEGWESQSARASFKGNSLPLEVDGDFRLCAETVCGGKNRDSGLEMPQDGWGLQRSETARAAGRGQPGLGWMREAVTSTATDCATRGRLDLALCHPK